MIISTKAGCRLVLALTLLLSSCAAVPPSFDEEAWQKDIAGQDPERLYAPHFESGAYFNPWMPMEQGRFGSFLKWRLSAKAEYSAEEKSYLPTVRPGLTQRIEDLTESDFIAWVGHATFLIRSRGEYWLTDPMFSQRALLPKRVTPPALSGSGLRMVTDRVNVLISHNHYDHLDKESLRSLPENSRLFVPAGLKKLIVSFYNGEIREMDWWEEIDLGLGHRLICLPAQHWSRRIGQGLNASLWASYLLVTPDASIYYGGDSGYFVGYREIGRRFPGIDYALLPLTAYHPRWFMHYAHMNAAEFVQAFEDLNASYCIPTQWGAFQLGDNPPGFPAKDLRRLLKEKDLDPSKFLIMDPGQIEVIKVRPIPAAGKTASPGPHGIRPAPPDAGDG